MAWRDSENTLASGMALSKRVRSACITLGAANAPPSKHKDIANAKLVRLYMFLFIQFFNLNPMQAFWSMRVTLSGHLSNNRGSAVG
jgi:hypothetical protein